MYGIKNRLVGWGVMISILAVSLLGVLITWPDSCDRAKADYDNNVVGKPVPVPIAAREMNEVLEACQP
jgi:hypothetical protein